jgi:hypothetical protein
MPEKQTAEAPRSLIRKLSKVMAQVERVAKNGENQFHHYKYAMEADLVDLIRPLLAAENVMVLPSMIETSRFQHTDKSDRVQLITDVRVKWTFEDGDSGETRECIFPGCGIDTGDKGIYKALTGSEKYLLMKTFLIATGDDPENDAGEKPTAPALKGSKVRDYKLNKPSVSPAATAGKVKGAPLGETGDVLTVEGPLGKVWVSNDFTNLIVNNVRIWTKDAEFSQLVVDLDRMRTDDDQPVYVEVIGAVGKTPTALELRQLHIKQMEVEEDEPNEIPF